MKKYVFLAFASMMLFFGCSQEQNNPPQISNISISPDCVAVGDVITLDCTASDPDGDVLTYQWSCSQWTSDKSGAEVTFVPDEAGDFQLTVSVSDGEATTTSDLTIIIHPQHPQLIVSLSDDDSVNCDLYLYHSGSLIASSTSADNYDSIAQTLDHNNDYELRIVCESGNGLYSISVGGDFDSAGYSGTLSETGDSIDVFFLNDCTGLSKID